MKIRSQIETNTTSKLNECIKKLTLPYFESFCQPFHIPFYYNVFDQQFCSYKNFFNRYIKTLLKSKYDWLLIFPYFIIFQCLVKTLSGKTSHTSLYLSSPKGKEKNWGNSLALKDVIRFKIELVYSILKLVI